MTKNHTFKKGDIVTIMNCKFDGTPFVEGRAAIVRHLFDERYVVRFDNGETVERFVDPQLNGK